VVVDLERTNTRRTFRSIRPRCFVLLICSQPSCRIAPCVCCSMI